MVTKIPDAEKSIIHLLTMIQIGHTEDDPIPLCLQENHIHQWMDFATISLQDIPTLF